MEDDMQVEEENITLLPVLLMRVRKWRTEKVEDDMEVEEENISLLPLLLMGGKEMQGRKCGKC